MNFGVWSKFKFLNDQSTQKCRAKLTAQHLDKVTVESEFSIERTLGWKDRKRNVR